MDSNLKKVRGSSPSISAISKVHSSFDTHKTVLNGDCLLVVTRWQSHLHSLVFILLGFCIFGFDVFFSKEANSYILLFSIICVLSGLALIWQDIDFILKKHSDELLEVTIVTRRFFFFKSYARLTGREPVSLQIIQKLVRKMNSVNSFSCYELNLMSSDGTRINMLNTGKLNRIEELAKQVKSFSDLDITLVDEIAELDVK